MLKLNKKSPPENQVSKIMICVYHDLSNCEYTINDQKNQDLCIKRKMVNIVYSHKNLLYGDL